MFLKFPDVQNIKNRSIVRFPFIYLLYSKLVRDVGGMGACATLLLGSENIPKTLNENADMSQNKKSRVTLKYPQCP